jgi:exopolysaccharide biosynthesis polyprenyl glycosylphosphotransferase
MTLLDDQVDPRPARSAAADPSNRLRSLDTALTQHETQEAVRERTPGIPERRRGTASLSRRGWLVRRTLPVADVMGLALAFGVTMLLFPAGAEDHLGPAGEFLLFLGTLPAWVVVAKLHGLYDHDEERAEPTTVDDVVGIFQVVTLGTWLVFLATWLSAVVNPPPAKLMTFWAAAIVLMTAGRAAARAFTRRRRAYLQNAVIVGAGDVGQLIAHKLLQHPEYGINLVGFLDATPKPRREDLRHLALLGPPDRAAAIVRSFDIQRVIIAFSNDSHQDTVDLVRVLNDLDVQVDIVPRLFDVIGPGVLIHSVEGVPLVGVRPLRLSRSSRVLKRTADLVLSGVGLVLLAPLFLVIACWIKLDSPGPVFFRQIRAGYAGKSFSIRKFRTMVADADARKHEVSPLNMHAQHGRDAYMFKVPNDPRVTSVGRFLRRYSLDELPQLLNVFTGEMSLVGPRPLVLDEDKHVPDWARRRLDIRPGITGLWQVLGRSEIPFEEMTKLDYLYVTNWTLWRDAQLLFRTIPAVFRPRRAY